jgi:hypothetical protein
MNLIVPGAFYRQERAKTIRTGIRTLCYEKYY